MIGIIDLNISNITSVEKALDFLDIRNKRISNSEDLSSCSKLILPGVGSYREGCTRLLQSGLRSEIIEFANNGKPILGICLGMQLLSSVGHEDGESEGLSLIGGQVSRMSVPSLKIPHVGWNVVNPLKEESELFFNIPQNTDFYFVHSYEFIPKQKTDIIASTPYGKPFASAVNHKNIYGVQFHPEKSQGEGLRLIKNFCELC